MHGNFGRKWLYGSVRPLWHRDRGPQAEGRLARLHHGIVYRNRRRLRGAQAPRKHGPVRRVMHGRERQCVERPDADQGPHHQDVRRHVHLPARQGDSRRWRCRDAPKLVRQLDRAREQRAHAANVRAQGAAGGLRGRHRQACVRVYHNGQHHPRHRARIRKRRQGLLHGRSPRLGEHQDGDLRGQGSRRYGALCCRERPCHRLPYGRRQLQGGDRQQVHLQTRRAFPGRGVHRERQNNGHVQASPQAAIRQRPHVAHRHPEATGLRGVLRQEGDRDAPVRVQGVRSQRARQRRRGQFVLDVQRGVWAVGRDEHFYLRWAGRWSWCGAALCEQG